MSTHEHEYRIGRFVYVPTKFNGYFEIYKHSETGQTIALALPNIQFTDNGLMDYEPAPDQGWLSQRHDNEQYIVGMPISPWGMAVREEVRLPRACWQRVVGVGETTLAIHIPPGGGMTPDACRDSIMQADAFFKQEMPNSPPAAVHCVSWIASPLLPKILPATANLIRFHQEAYLYPVYARHHHGLRHLFGSEPIDPATASRETGLQRAIADYLQQGHQWRIGGIFFLFEDLPHYGSQWYRSHWPQSTDPGLPPVAKEQAI